MSEDQRVDGIDNPGASGKGDHDDANDQEFKNPSYESYRKVLAEKKKEASKRRELEQRLAEIEAEREAQREAEMAEQGKYKEMLVEQRKKYEALQSEYNETKKTIDNSFKFNALKKALGAEIDYKWADFLEVKGVYDQIELGEGRRPDEMSVTKVCDFIRKEYPEMIAPVRKGDLPNASPQAGSALSYEQWLQLPPEEMKKRIKEVIKE